MPSSRPHVVYVESNIKGGVSCAIGPKTLIIGPTGSGKSAVVNTIELALTGKASDVRGREYVAAEALLMSLATDRAAGLFANVKLSDGTEAKWTAAAAAKGSAKKPVHVVPPGVIADKVMPLRAVTDAITAEVGSARRKFLKQVVGAITDADVIARLPSMLQGRYKVAVAGSSASDTAVDRLLRAIERAHDEARAANSRIKASAETAEQSARNLAPPPTEQQVEAAKAALAAAKLEHERVLKLHHEADMVIRSQTAVSNAQKEMAETQAELVKTQAVLAPLEQQIADLKSQRAATMQYIANSGWLPHLAAVMTAQVSGTIPSHECMECGAATTKEAVQVRLDFVKQHTGKVQEAYDRVGKLTAAIELAEGQAVWYRAALEAQTTKIQQTTVLLANFQSGAVDKAQLPNLDAARNALSAAEVAVSRLSALASAWEVTNRARNAAAGDQTLKAEWAQLADECLNIVEQLLDQNSALLCEKVQARLPAHLTFGLKLREGTREVFEIGFMRDGALKSAVSGGEWAQMTAALADVFAAETGPAIVVPFDRQMDSATLTAALEAWANQDAQFIVTSVVEPTRIPEGWTVIRTVAGEHRLMAGKGQPLPHIEARTLLAQTQDNNVEVDFRPDAAPVAPPVAPPVVTEVKTTSTMVPTMRIIEAPADPPKSKKVPAVDAAAVVAAVAESVSAALPAAATAEPKKLTKPRKRKDESDTDFAARMAEYEQARAAKAAAKAPATPAPKPAATDAEAAHEANAVAEAGLAEAPAAMLEAPVVVKDGGTETKAYDSVEFDPTAVMI